MTYGTSRWGRAQAETLRAVVNHGSRKAVDAAFSQAGQSRSSAGAALNKCFVLGYVRKLSERGRWEITARGRTALQHFDTDQMAKTKFCVECGIMFGPKPMPTSSKYKKGYYTTTKFCCWKCFDTYRIKNAKGAIKDGYRIILGKREHRSVMEQILGRELKRYETVHHKNGERHDNRPGNLELWAFNHPPGQRADEQDIWSGNIAPYHFGAL
jgi:hypothetical protein